MKSAKRSATVMLSLSAMLLTNCSGIMNKDMPDVSVDSTFIRGITERQIGDSGLSIGIPTDYTLEENEGPDFMVYYFYPTDTTITPDFSGGFYLGNFPSLFPPDSAGCMEGMLKSKVMGKTEEWTTHNCGGEHSIQTIIEAMDEEWPSYIHVFATAASEDNLNKVRYIYSTMQRK